MHMHRRNQRSEAHITPPPSAKFHGPMSSDSDRHLGFRNRTPRRIWLLIIALLAVLGITHYILPYLFSARNGNDDATRPYSNSHLTPKNYLNLSSTGEHPRAFDFCLAHGKGDKIGQKYGPVALSQTRLHLGSSARIQRVISKALAGQPVTISVLGGSVSACHGAGDDHISPKCYPSRFFQWWNTIFPHPASELTNGAMRLSTSEYFGYCSTHHIPDVTDLIIVELDASDNPNDAKAMTEHFEILIRSLLIRPDSPAVLLLGHFSPQLWIAHGAFGADHFHSVAAQFYDVPHLSTKSLLFSDFMREPRSINRFYVDPILASADGHELITDVLIGYFQTQICQVWDDVVGGDSLGHIGSGGQVQGGGGGGGGLFGGVGQRKGVPEPHPNHLDGHEEVEVDAEGNRIKLGLPNRISDFEQRSALLGVPPARMSTKPNQGKPFEEIAPFCVSANDLVNPLPPSLFEGSGWTAFHPGGVGGQGNVLNTKAHYWYSTLVGSRLRIPIIVGAGDVGVYYLVNGSGEGSEVNCQVDDNYGGAMTLSNVVPGFEDNTPRLTMIDHFVSRGNHFIECQLVGDEEQKGVPAFKILGFFAT
ncbi:hypothetical protein E1B28_010215 [Marasmius oreades]|uniref:Capsular associated protein n=1 Tax=Marasmius oreades TaxID=181124 RepID=A0A9P7RXC5_9AGAR|nr:uncharacterized protein E1B28_010215 [Marasmius oreades]KAG7091162.1 hypothetical protein E1B28_010215 [Marasmius oreades]